MFIVSFISMCDTICYLSAKRHLVDCFLIFFFFQAEDGIRDIGVTGVQTCALPIWAAMTLFTTGPDGMTGNDDLGTMSAWYVLSSLGLYPTTAGGNFFALSSPQFPADRKSVV